MPPPPAPLTITTLSLPNGSGGVAYVPTSIVATGGTPPYSFSVALGTLPSGLILSSAGVVSGTPTGAPGVSAFTVQVTDSALATDTQALSITIT